MACRNCSPVSEVQGKLTIQKYGEHMYQTVQRIQKMLKENDRYKIRLARMPELQPQYNVYKEQVRCAISEYVSLFENAYYSKLKVHNPKVADALDKFRLNLLSNKILQDL